MTIDEFLEKYGPAPTLAEMHAWALAEEKRLTPQESDREAE